MRFLLAFVLSSALTFGCGDNGGDTGGGGAGGDAGGEGGAGGVGGTGGVGGAGVGVPLKFTLSVEPALPCEQGVPSDYLVSFVVESAPSPVMISGQLVGCAGLISEETNTIRCPNDDDRITYQYMVQPVDEGGIGLIVQSSGQVGICVTTSLPYP